MMISTNQNSLLYKVTSYFAVRTQADFETYQEKLFTTFFTVYTLLTLTYAQMGLSSQEIFADYLTFGLLLILWGIFKATKAAKHCANALFTINYVHVFYLATLTGGIHSSSVCWYTFIPTLALMLSRKMAIFWTIASIAALSLLAALNYCFDDIQHFRFQIEDTLWSTVMQMTITVGATYSIWLHEILNNARQTNLNQKTRELDLKHVQLKKTQAHKDEFIASVGHELRTPMNAILGFNELLSHEVKSARAQEIIQNIQSSAKQLLKVISDILDYSQLIAGKLRLLKKNQSIATTLERAVTKARQQAQGKPIEITLHITSLTPATCEFDAVRIEQVMHHLLNNAMKFMTAGRIEVYSIAGVDRLRIEVRDHGIGISPERQKNIFNRFVHANTEVNRRYGGTGLGLTICEQLVELHGGCIGVNSVLGRGSTFWFELPLTSQSLIPEPLPKEILKPTPSTRYTNVPWTIKKLGKFTESLYFSALLKLDAKAPESIKGVKLEAKLGMLINGSLASPIYIFCSTCPELFVIHSLYPVLYFFILRAMIRGVRFSRMVHLLIGSTFAYVSAAALYAGGTMAVITSWLPMISLPAFNLFGKKIASVCLSVSLAIQVGFYFITRYGYTPYPWESVPQPIFFYWFSYVHITLLLLYLPMHYKNIHTKINDAIEQHNRSLEQAQLSLIEEQKQKDEFISTVSHEFRTPMNAIIGFNHLLADEIQHEPHAQDLQMHVTQSAEHLLIVIDDILDYSQLQSGSLTIRYETFNLPQSLQKIYNIFQSKINNNAIQFEVKSNEIPSWIMGDRHRLTQILINLVGNALKFTEKGFVELRATQHNNGILFEIEDSGIGISVEKIDLIFGQFERVHQESAAGYAGHGLGLAISKRLVELQNGTIQVQSTLGTGSLFSVWLPYPTCDMPTQTIHANHLQSNEIENLHILVVDDHPLNRLLASQMLQKNWPHARIDEADNGLSALKKLHQNHYDIVIMDMVMPEMDGIEATRVIRESLDSPFNNIPIIGLTANINPIERERCLQVGMNEIIYKPFQMDDLVKTIRHLTNTKKLESAALAL
jgi:signal transduction histidine kinase/ActR/RegA family two-component response regulator